MYRSQIIEHMAPSITYFHRVNKETFVITYTSHTSLTVDFGEVNTASTECKEKCFPMMLSAYLDYSKAPVLMLMIHLTKRSGR